MNAVSLSGTGTADTDALRRVEPLLALVRDSQDDPELRSRMDRDAAGVLVERGLDVPPGIDVRLVRNTPDTFHIVVPPDPNTAIADDELATVAGGIGGYWATQLVSPILQLYLANAIRDRLNDS